MNQAPSSFYGRDLAYTHDSGFGKFAVHGAKILVDRLRRSGQKTGRIVNLGCGGGIESEIVSAAGFDVVGIDISPDMIAMARKRVPGAEFRVESCLSAALPSCIAVTAIGECLNYLADPANSEAALLRLFQRIYEALEPGGLFLFDVAGLGRALGAGSQKSFREEEDWAVLVVLEEDSAQRQLTRRITSFRKVGELYRRGTEVHRLRLFARSEMVAQLRRVGFRVSFLAGYGSLRFRRGHFGFLARRP
jgi:SAM-dependent methyltransferase